MHDAKQQRAYSRFLHDVFVTAIEGGVNHWFTCNKYRWLTADGMYDDLKGFFASGVADDETELPLRIDRDVIIAGLLRILDCSATFAGVPLKPDSRIGNTVATACKYDDLYGYDEDTIVDADIADCIVQVGLFGDVRYG